jgi:hypothetical protein
MRTSWWTLIVKKRALDLGYPGGSGAFIREHQFESNGELVLGGEMAPSYHKNVLDDLKAHGIEDDDIFLDDFAGLMLGQERSDPLLWTNWLLARKSENGVEVALAQPHEMDSLGPAHEQE